jgi:hypothetical protein
MVCFAFSCFFRSGTSCNPIHGSKKIWKRICKEIAFKPVAIHLSYNAQVQRPDIWASSPKNWFKTSYAHILVAGFLPGQPKLRQGVALADQQSSLMANPTVRTKTEITNV